MADILYSEALKNPSFDSVFLRNGVETPIKHFFDLLVEAFGDEFQIFCLYPDFSRVFAASVLHNESKETVFENIPVSADADRIQTIAGQAKKKYADSETLSP